MATQVAKVKARARPWRSIIALTLALASLAAAETGLHALNIDHTTARLLRATGAIAFFLFGVAAAYGLSGQVRNLVEPHIGAAHAGVVRYALALAGVFTVLVVALNVSSLPVGQLLLGGAVTGVLLGIAAQQSLANLFAGLVLLFARPFRVGDRVRFRAGALGGSLEGTVTDISITYVRLETADGVVFVPNSQALAATVGPLPLPLPPPAPADPAPVDEPVLAPAPGAPSPPPPAAPVVPSDSSRTWQSPGPGYGPDHSP
jgi:small-conductance mechanosensitive channel